MTAYLMVCVERGLVEVGLVRQGLHLLAKLHRAQTSEFHLDRRQQILFVAALGVLQLKEVSLKLAW